MNLDIGGEGLRIGKYGWVKCRGLRLEAIAADKLQSVTVYREAGNYYASIMYREELDYPKEHVHSGSSCGIDIGVEHPVTLVNDLDQVHFKGKVVQERLKHLELKRKSYQRRVDRKMKGSKRREKAKIRVQRVYQAEKFVRKDFNHKLSNSIARCYETVVMEDLNLKNMTRSAKGTLEKPGTNVRAKSGLNRELLRIGSGQLYQFLKYKVLRYGGRLVLVNPAFTSQTCHSCGCVDKRNRKNQATFHCTSCGHKAHADANAARNIRYLGVCH
jgi:putative transposase